MNNNNNNNNSHHNSNNHHYHPGAMDEPDSVDNISKPLDFSSPPRGRESETSTPKVMPLGGGEGMGMMTEEDEEVSALNQLAAANKAGNTPGKDVLKCPR